MASTNLVIVLFLIVEKKLQSFFSDLWLMVAATAMALLDFDGRASLSFFLLDFVGLTSHLAFTNTPYYSHSGFWIVPRLLNFSGKRRVGLY